MLLHDSMYETEFDRRMSTNLPATCTPFLFRREEKEGNQLKCFASMECYFSNIFHYGRDIAPHIMKPISQLVENYNEVMSSVFIARRPLPS